MRRLVLILMIIATPALAQQRTIPPSEQALGEQVMQEVQAAVALRAKLIEAQREIAAKDARIKELEAKVSTAPTDQPK